MKIEKLNQLYEGKAKKVFATNDPELLIVDYKDDATAFNGLKKGTIESKGIINNKVSNYLMKMLEQHGIPTHLVEEISDRETIVKTRFHRAAGGHRPQYRRGFPFQAPGAAGGHQAQEHGAGVLLQGRCAGRSHGQRLSHLRHGACHEGRACDHFQLCASRSTRSLPTF